MNNIKFSEIHALNYQNNSLVTLYPNPISETLYLAVNAVASEKATIKILDASGRLVMQIETQLHHGKNTISIYIKELPSAIYQIKMDTENGIYYNNKFIKK